MSGFSVEGEKVDFCNSWRRQNGLFPINNRRTSCGQSKHERASRMSEMTITKGHRWSNCRLQQGLVQHISEPGGQDSDEVSAHLIWCFDYLAEYAICRAMKPNMQYYIYMQLSWLSSRFDTGDHIFLDLFYDLMHCVFSGRRHSRRQRCVCGDFVNLKMCSLSDVLMRIVFTYVCL